MRARREVLVPDFGAKCNFASSTGVPKLNLGTRALLWVWWAAAWALLVLGMFAGETAKGQMHSITPQGPIPPTPQVLYVETSGSDATAQIGDPARPWASGSAAFAAALALYTSNTNQALVIRFGVGSWTINLPVVTTTVSGIVYGAPVSWPSSICIAGAGVGVTSIVINGAGGDIAGFLGDGDTPDPVGAVSAGASLSITDAGNHSFCCVANAGTVTDFYSNDPVYASAAAGSVTMVNCTGTANAGSCAGMQFGFAAPGGNVTMVSCVGDGYSGSGSSYSDGNPGTPVVVGGGNVLMVDCMGDAVAGTDTSNLEDGTVTLVRCVYQFAGVGQNTGLLPSNFLDMSIGNTICNTSNGNPAVSTFFDSGSPPLPSSNTMTTLALP